MEPVSPPDAPSGSLPADVLAVSRRPPPPHALRHVLTRDGGCDPSWNAVHPATEPACCGNHVSEVLWVIAW